MHLQILQFYIKNRHVYRNSSSFRFFILRRYCVLLRASSQQHTLNMQHNSPLTYWKTAFISVLYVVHLQDVGFRLDSFRLRRFSRIICRFSTCIVVCRITVVPNCYFLRQGFICILHNNDKVSGTVLFRNGEGRNWYSNP